MKKGLKISLLVVSHAVITALGFYGGIYYYDKNIVAAEAIASDYVLIARYANLVEFQQNNGTNDDYRNALNMFLEVLDRADYENNPLLDKNTYLTDKALTYARLSLLEERVKNNDSASNYMKQAINSCKPLSRDWCTPDKLKKFITELNKTSSNNTLQPTQKPRG
ncbi:MAG: hypothetical protein OEY52_14890 [Gammaproteobacteria bacterium]|nr:hypothetical protein [Gammaproteobacteria bacterium]